MTATTAPPATTFGQLDRPALRWLGALIAIVAVGLSSWSVVGRLTEPSAPATGLGPMESVDQAAFAGATGVWVEHVRLLGGGGLVEIRYRILDVEKSEIVHDYDYPPRIFHEDGFELRWQRHEHSHVRENRLAATYNEQLVNLGSYFQPGDIVTVYIGEHALEGVPIQ